jgi:hypothetical protein
MKKNKSVFTLSEWTERHNSYPTFTPLAWLAITAISAIFSIGVFALVYFMVLSVSMIY